MAIEDNSSEPIIVDPNFDLSHRLQWFQEVILPLEPGLRSRLRYIVRQQADVDDLVADVLLRAYSCGSPQSVTAPVAWLNRIARNLLIDAARRERIVRLDSVAYIDLLDDDYAAERGMVARDQLRRAQIVIDALPQQQRRAFLLRRLEGHSMKEVAGIMLLSVSTVEKHVARAINALANALGEDETTSDERDGKCSDGRYGRASGRPSGGRTES